MNILRWLRCIWTSILLGVAGTQMVNLHACMMGAPHSFSMESIWAVTVVITAAACSNALLLLTERAK